MHKHSMNDVQAIIDELPTLAGQLERGKKVAILQAVANEPGWATDEAVNAYAQEFLRIWQTRLMAEVI